MGSFLPGWDTVFTCCREAYDCTEPARNTMDALRTNHNSLRNQRLMLSKKVTSIESQIPKAKINGMKLDPVVDGWIQISKEKLNQADGILGNEDAPRPLPAKCPGGCFYKNCCVAHEQAKEVEEILALVNQQLNAAPGDGDQIFISDSNIDMERDESPVPVGLEDNFHKANTYLKKSGFGCLGVHGMGGVGKTELLGRLFVSLQRSQMGNQKGKIFKVDMTNALDLPRARLAIGKKLDLQISDENVVTKQKITRALQEYDFVLLLDDLQLSDSLILDNLGIPKGGSKSSKVVFTTRDEGVCSRMGDNCEKIEMGCLTEQDSWILFKREVGEKTLNSHPDIHGVAEEIASLCGGLPLALVTIGRAMRDKTDPDEWKLEKENLSRLNLNFNDMYEDVRKLLEKSFEKLEDTAKSCFLYASLFPTKYLPEQEELVNYWFSEGFLKVYDQPKDNLLHGRCMIPKLKRANLFNHDKGSTTVNMHDMLRGAALSTLKETCYVWTRDEKKPNTLPTLVELPDNRDWSKVERISLMGNYICKLKAYRFGKLSTLFLQKSTIENLADDFFVFMPSLSVLNMSGCNIDYLPASLTKLTALQYLNVSHTEVSELPSDLKSLENLKFLNLSHLPKLGKIPSQLIESFSKLIKLDIYNSGIKESTNFIPNIKLGNVLSEDSTALVEEINKLNSLCDLSLTVKSKSSVQELLKSKKLLKLLHRVFITKCKGLVTLEVPPFGDVENLKVLRIYNCPELVNFTIVTTENMQVIPDFRAGSVAPASSFLNLHEIEIGQCWELNDLSWIKYTPKLQTLKIEKCKEVKVVISSSENNGVVTDIHQNILPELKTLYLGELPSLMFFCDVLLNLSSLEEITVLDCPKMEKLPLKLEKNKEKMKSITINSKTWQILKWDSDETKATFEKFCKFK